MSHRWPYSDIETGDVTEMRNDSDLPGGTLPDALLDVFDVSVELKESMEVVYAFPG